MSDQELHLRTLIDKLERENVALREDKDRLDWLERSQKLWEGKDCSSGPEFITRAAIDVARKEQP